MSAAIQLSLSTVKFLVGDVELQKEAMCWADAVTACAGKPLPSPSTGKYQPDRTGRSTVGLHHK